MWTPEKIMFSDLRGPWEEQMDVTEFRHLLIYFVRTGSHAVGLETRVTLRKGKRGHGWRSH